MTPEELPAGPVPEARVLSMKVSEAVGLLDRILRDAPIEYADSHPNYFKVGAQAYRKRTLKDAKQDAKLAAKILREVWDELDPTITSIEAKACASPSPAVAQPVTDERCVALDDVINVLTKRIQSRYQDHQRTDGETGERYFDTDHAEQMEAAYHAELGALSEVMTLKNAARAALCQSSTVRPVAVAMNLTQGD